MEGFTLTKDPFIGTKGFIWIERAEKQFSIKNFQRDLLTVNPEESSASFKSEDNFEGKNWLFYLNTFKEVAGQEGGLPVAINYDVGCNNHILSVEDGSVIFKEIEFPETIPLETSEFIFYKRDHGDGLISLESSLERGSYLAYSDDDQNLILKPCSEDELDETATFYFAFSGLESLVIQPNVPNTPYHFRNMHSDLLIANTTDSIATFKSDGHPEVEQAVFYLNTYKSNDTSNTGLPVAIRCHVGEKNYILRVENNSVILKEGNLPEVIASRTSEYIFYATDFSDAQPVDNLMKFESSSEQKRFLAWQTTDPEKKLILKTDNANHIDETICFALKEKN